MEERPISTRACVRLLHAAQSCYPSQLNLNSTPRHVRPSTCPPLPCYVASPNPQNDEWGALHASGLHVTGRILLNLWRVLRGELKLGSYSFESCCAAVLGLRVPRVREQQLALWFAAGRGARAFWR